MTPTEPRPLTRDALLSLAGRKSNPIPLAIVMSDDETRATSQPWNGPLPEITGGYILQTTAFATNPKPGAAQAAKSSSGPDLLLADIPTDPWPEGVETHASFVETVEVRGHLVAVRVNRRVELRHVSSVGTFPVFAIDICPATQDRSKHPTTPDGRRIAAFSCIIGSETPSSVLLSLLASRASAADIVVLPSAAANFLPGMPTVGEPKRRAKGGKAAPLDFESIMSTVQARRTPTGIRVRLDSMSMRLAAESFHKRPRGRSTAVQALLEFPTTCGANDDELRAAVEAQLSHFDTDYLLTFDAVQAILGRAAGPGKPGIALDDELQNLVGTMRFGPSQGRSRSQAERIARHFETMRRVSIVIEPEDRTRQFRGPLIVRTGEISDMTRHEPLKVGDRIMLNPDLYRDLGRGKGLHVDARYFRLDPYRDDWELRLYRYLAGRWSMSSVKLEGRNDWEISLRLRDALDMAGIDWRTDVKQRGRSEREARRKVDAALGRLQDSELIGGWRVDGTDMDMGCMLRATPTDGLRAALVGSRPKLHAAAAAGSLKKPETRKRRRRRRAAKSR
jgi:hypothetical protein